MSKHKVGRWVTACMFVGFMAVSKQSLPADLSQQFQPVEQINDEKGSAATRYDSPEQQDRPEPNATIADSLAKIAGSLQAPESQEETERSRQDLKAQESMAYYAWIMAVVAGIQALLTFFGIVLVWRTLAATQKATKAAAKAAKAAEDAVTVTRELGQKQVRAYLAFAGPFIIQLEPNQPIIFKFQIANAGQTPAYEVTAVCGIHVSQIDNPKPLKFKTKLTDVDSRKHPIAPGGSTTITVPSRVAINEGNYQNVVKGKVQLYALGVVSYRDVFRRLRRTTYLGMIDSEKLADGERAFVFCEKGNRAT